MQDFVLEELAATAEWRAVLQAYQKPAEAASNAKAADGWLPRVRHIDGVETAQLARLHGNLIALGFLKFEISGTTGMQYQISPLGRQTLERGLPVASDEMDTGLATESASDE